MKKVLVLALCIASAYGVANATGLSDAQVADMTQAAIVKDQAQSQAAQLSQWTTSQSAQSPQGDAQRVATSFLAGRFIAPASVTVRGDTATVMAQVADMACRVELTREVAGSRDEWHVIALNCNKANTAH